MYVMDVRCSTKEFASLTKVRHNSQQFMFIEDLAAPLVHHLN